MMKKVLGFHKRNKMTVVKCKECVYACKRQYIAFDNLGGSIVYICDAIGDEIDSDWEGRCMHFRTPYMEGFDDVMETENVDNS